VLKNKIFYLILSLVISIFLIGLLLSRIQARELAQTLVNIHLPALFAYLGLGLLAAWLRAWRYRFLLHPQPITWKDMFLTTLIRNCFDDLLPARVGSLSYIYVLNKRLSVPFETAASTFVVAFVFDFLTLGPFLALAIIIVGLGISPLSTPIWLAVSLLFFGLILAILWKLVPLCRSLLSAYQFLLKLFKADQRKGSRHSVAKLRLTIDALLEIQARKIYAPVFLLSLIIRLCKYISLYVLLFALLRSHGILLAQLSFWKTILGTTAAEITSTLPIKGLADFGTWESAWAVAFRLMNFEAGLAIISGIGVHLITNIFEYSLGVLSILALALPYARKNR